jgi:UDP-N-acetylmuramoyl-L-alanyl-D-glutamate--2,6-diaminopimelate ligase
MQLGKLLPHISLSPAVANTDIISITEDSRTVTPGALFAAVCGSVADGRAYIHAALEKGAAAILLDTAQAVPEGIDITGLPVPVIATDQVRQHISLVASKLYPLQPDIVTAVTGTNGKTSTAIFTQAIWQACGLAAASMGTLGVQSPTGNRYDGKTTASASNIHQDLDELARGGIQRAVLEASSHGLDQHRLDNVRIRVAGFTNFTRDHMDYHKTETAYFAAKTRLFAEVMSADGIAILNADDPQFLNLETAARTHKVIPLSYGLQGRDFCIRRVTPTPAGLELVLRFYGERQNILLPIAGTFQAHNATCALAMALASGTDPVKAVSALAHLPSVPGRLEAISGHSANAQIYVDYAHTPDALRTAIAALRPHTARKLHVVFGCGGNRDAGKRPQMGHIAAEMADHCIITDDNPRFEDSTAILKDIQAGIPADQTHKVTTIANRADAIAAALTAAGNGDVVLIAGKGHETGQIIGDQILPFSDQETVRTLIQPTAANANKNNHHGGHTA